MYDEKKFQKYLRSVEDFFIEKRGTPFILSSKDVQLILFWFKREIPLKIVKKGIKGVFEKLKEKKIEKRINSIKYCAQKIEELNREEQKRISRSWHSEGQKIDIFFSLEKNKELIISFFQNKDKYKRQRDNFLKTVEKLKSLENLDEVEDNLKKIEEKIIEIFYKNLSQNEKDELKKEAEKKLPDEVKNLPQAVKRSLVKMVVFEKIKKEINIPTLSLLL